MNYQQAGYSGFAPGADRRSMAYQGLYPGWAATAVVPATEPASVAVPVVLSLQGGGAGSSGGSGGFAIQPPARRKRDKSRLSWSCKSVLDGKAFVCPPRRLGETTITEIPLGVEGAIEAARIVASTASRDSLRDEVRQLALEATDGLGASPTVLQQARLLLSFVRRNVRYVPDPVGADRFTAPVELIAAGRRGDIVAGDCADHVGLFVAMAASLGIDTAVVLQPEAQPKAHVIAAVRDGTRWVPVDVVDRELGLGETGYTGPEVWLPLPGTSFSTLEGRDDKVLDRLLQGEQGRYVGVGAATGGTGVAFGAERGAELQQSAGPGVGTWLLVALAGMAVGGLVIWLVMR